MRISNTMIQTLWNLRRDRKPGWLQTAKTLIIGTRDMLALTSTCRCSWTIEWNSAFAGSISDRQLNQAQIAHLSNSRRSRSWIIVTSIDGFWAKTTPSLPNYRTRGNCREDVTHKILQETTAVFAEFFSEQAVVYPFERTTDGSPLENSLLQWLLNTNDLGACTLPSSRRPNHYSDLTSGENNSQIGRAPRTPDSNSQPAQIPVQWSCVQLKQHRQLPENDKTWEPQYPQSGQSNEDQTKSDTKNFLVPPCGSKWGANRTGSS